MGRRQARKQAFVREEDLEAEKQVMQRQREVKMYQRNIRINDLTRQQSIRSVAGKAALDSARSQWIQEDPTKIEVNEKGGTFGDQFLATLERTIQQKRRNLLSFALEMLVPLLFVVGTIVLWAAFGDEKVPEKSMLNYTTVTSPQVLPTYYTYLMCYNASEGVIEGLPKCDSTNFTFDCAGDDSTLPVKGLCYNKESTPEQVVGGYLNSLLGNLAAIPPLDTIILNQWMARKAGRSSSSAAALTLSGSGLVANTRLNAITSSGQIYFAPKANVPDSLIEYFHNGSKYFKYVYGTTFDTVEEAEEYVRTNSSLHWCIVEIKSLTADNFDVQLHMNHSALPPLDDIVDLAYPGGFQFDRGEMYLASGFSSIQRILYNYHLEMHLNHSTQDINPFYAAFGSGAYRRKVLLETASPLIAFILVLSFLYPVSQLTKQIVLEKELRIREAMLIMGLSNSSLYLSWFVVYALQYLLECIIMVVLLKATYIISSDAFVVFMVFYIFALSTIPLSGLIASFFSKARLASMLSPLIYFVLSVPIFAFTSASANVIIGVSVLSPTALAALLTNIMTVETSVGFSAVDLHNKQLTPESWILLMELGLDFVGYYLLMFYFDAVLPKDWGTTKNPIFFLTDPVRACLRCCSDRNAAVKGTNEDGRAADGVFEEVDDSEDAVRMVGLRKEYKRGGKKFTAVNNLYWSMRSGEISVLLGHNGAGKSTAMNMITGMIEPDEGDCFMNKYSVRHELDRVRQQIGFCPQHNILWPELTCREHLEYFGKIKGLYGSILEEAVRMMLAEVDLLDKKDYPSSALSGGQKRKLSVAIAFVGRSPLVFLDEPTAGMDVGARRYTWELLRRMSVSHTMLLTTHYMDEADLLGHRIAIMSRGSLQCSGSSMFLKSRLGVGYNMSISMDPDADAESIDQLVVSLVASAEASSFNGVEIVYKLPMKDVEQFPNLLSGLEQYGDDVGVRGYSLSATTLEEVFLQIALDDKHKRDAEVSGEVDQQKAAEEDHMVWTCELMTSSCSRFHSQFRAMMGKRFWNSLRDRKMQCFQIVCPVVCILLAMLLTLVKLGGSTDVTLDLSAAMFGEDIEMVVSNCESYFGTISPTTPRQDTYVLSKHFYDAEDLSFYAIDTGKTVAHPRYTSVQCNDIGVASVLTGMYTSSVLFYNTSAYHASGLVLTQFYNFILQNLTRDVSKVFRTTVSSMPDETGSKGTMGGVQTILIGAIVMIPFTFLPANPVAWVVKERECKARHLQNVTGLSFYVYWLTNFIFDFAAYIVTLILVMVIFFIFKREEYVSGENVGPTIVMFLVYGLCSTVASYCVSFAFDEHSAAQTTVMAVSFVSGFMLVMMVFILSLVDKTKDVSTKLPWAFRIVPSYSVGESIINLAMNEQQKLVGANVSAWDFSVTGWPMIYMAAEFPVFLFLTLFIDHPRRRLWGQAGLYKRSAPAEVIDDEDSDVEDERKAVYEAEANNINEDIVRVVDLRKVYENGKVAVRNLSFSILPDEVFGFLGTNGAGKTTAISMFCQEFVPSSGCVYVCGYDVVDQSSEAIQCIGYCPQFDATLDLLTVEEHLRLYAGIRGIEFSQRDAVVNGLMRLCEIMEYRKTKAGSLSGGNRRKLSVAMCLIGSPQIVFLDEPSAGMDPVARRGLWTAIQKVSQNCSVVLTTHHLEEVEALADTVAIMADGALRCIGDKIHLKNKYGSGFEMSIRIAAKENREPVERFVAEAFPDAVLSEFKGQRFVYALPQDTRLSETFWALQQNKDILGITDYSVSQTSIEQVFLRISEQQEERTALGERVIRFTDSHAKLHHYRSSGYRRPAKGKDGKNDGDSPTSLKTAGSDEGSSGNLLTTARSDVNAEALEAYRARQAAKIAARNAAGEANQSNLVSVRSLKTAAPTVEQPAAAEEADYYGALGYDVEQPQGFPQEEFLNYVDANDDGDQWQQPEQQMWADALPQESPLPVAERIARQTSVRFVPTNSEQQQQQQQWAGYDNAYGGDMDAYNGYGAGEAAGGGYHDTASNYAQGSSAYHSQGGSSSVQTRLSQYRQDGSNANTGYNYY